MLAMVVILAFTFVFVGHRMFAFAFLFFTVFLAIFISWLTGPVGERMIEKFQKKHPPVFQLPDEEDQEKIREQIKLMKEYKEAIKEMKEDRR